MAIKFISPLGNVQRRDYELADGSTELFFTTNPNASTGSTDPEIVDAGMFGMLDSNGKLKVATGGTSNSLALLGSDTNNAAGNNSIPVVMLIITQKGDYTAQAINKVTCITHGGIDIKTDLYEGTPALGDGLGLYGGKLKVVGANASKAVVGVCVAAPSGGFLEVRLFASPQSSAGS